VKADIVNGVLHLTPESGVEGFGLSHWLSEATSNIGHDTVTEKQKTYLKGTAVKVVQYKHDHPSDPPR